MKISVITVSYNGANTISDTLQSVNAQTHADVEHVIVDGGSTDDTMALVRTEGLRVARSVSEPDRGIYDAMNKGVRLATGDVLAFLNADDRYAHIHVLEEVAGLFERAQVDAVFGNVAFFHPSNPERLVRHYDSARFHPSRLAWGWMPAHPAAFFRRSVYARTGMFKDNYRIAGDYEWIARAFQRGPLSYRHLPEVLVHMQMGGVSTRGWRNSWVLNKEVLQACRENDIATNWFKILSKYPAKLAGLLWS
jgi:glycosyltransferase involved in cell wall biosynthesis